MVTEVGFTEEALRAVVVDYDQAKRRLLEQRDAHLRDFHEHGWRSVDLQRVTGYSRETIRHALNPEIRQAANASRRKPSRRRPATPSAGESGYADTRPYVVADDLADLHGPIRGTITLPRHLDWSARPTYELDRPARLASMYRVVLNEASTVADLRDWLDARVLIELWPKLWLPERLRDLWEGTFPELAARRPAIA